MKQLILFIILIVAVSASPKAKEITLEEAIRRAKETSQKYRAAEAMREAADYAFQSAKAERFPTLSATATASYISEVPKLNISLPIGPSLSREMGTHENYQTDVRVSVPLFTGGRLSGNTALASASRDMAGASLAQVYQTLVLETRQAVINLYRTDKQLQAAQTSLTRTRTLERDVHSLFEAGAADSVDLLEVTLAISNTELKVDVAKTARISSAIQLGRLIGEPEPGSLEIVDQFELPANDDSLLILPGEDKFELLQANASIATAEAQRRMAGSDWFPTVAVYGGYSYGKPNLDRFNDRWNDYLTAGATLSWSLNLGGKTSSQVRRATYSRDAYSRIAQDIRTTLDQNARTAREQIVLAARRFRTSVTAYTIASERFRLASAQHREGTLSTNRLTDIQESLAMAENDKAVALADYHWALSQYYFVTGSDKLERGF